jgi:hypothetical protein
MNDYKKSGFYKAWAILRVVGWLALVVSGCGAVSIYLAYA